MLDGVKQMIGFPRSERVSRASVPQRNGGRVDKRIRLESGRLKRPGGSNPSRSARSVAGNSPVGFSRYTLERCQSTVEWDVLLRR